MPKTDKFDKKANFKTCWLSVFYECFRGERGILSPSVII